MYIEQAVMIGMIEAELQMVEKPKGRKLKRSKMEKVENKKGRK